MYNDDIANVSESEHNMIMMARSLIMSNSTLSVPRTAKSPPPLIGPTCAQLIGDALTQVWPALWRKSGAMPGANINGDKVVRGRVWERTEPVGLTYTKATLMLLRWLTSKQSATLPVMPLSIGDQVILYLAMTSAQGAELTTLASQPFARESGLARLGFAHEFGGQSSNPKLFDAMVSGAGAVVVSALTNEIAARWRAVELTKRSITDPVKLISIGAAQDRALNEFMEACDHASRRDLAKFVIDAIAPLLAKNIPPTPPPLDSSAPLGVRANARKSAGALIRGLMTWHKWDQDHRSIRFIDNNYQGSQLLLSYYEKIGAELTERAQGWLSDLNALTPIS